MVTPFAVVLSGAYLLSRYACLPVHRRHEAPRQQLNLNAGCTRTPLLDPLSSDLSGLPVVSVLELPRRFAGCSRLVTFGSQPGAEYDQDLIFHDLLRQSYPRLTTDIANADLVYVPFHPGTYLCNEGAAQGIAAIRTRDVDSGATRKMQGLLHAFANIVEPIMVANPRAYFFTVVGSVASCNDHHNPLPKDHPQRHRLRVMAWESAPYMDQPNVVMPYFVTDPDVWGKQHTQRRLLVLNTASSKRGKLSATCGICYHGNPTPALCRTLRPELAASMQKHSAEVDVGILSSEVEMNTQVYGRDFAMATRDSIFCLQPPGDTVTRLAFYQSIVFGCIPVVFRQDHRFVEQFAFAEVIPYRRLWLHVPAEDVLNGLDIVEFLRSVPAEAIREKQGLLHKYRHAVSYSLGTSSGPNALLMSISAMRASVSCADNRSSPAI
eukprot:TRINITY_DN5291_c0_g3_i1.p1 TRINITY_DN5291_c0_g3~~TRINITY_DN5291_c0_g3_i1.p1  ORF type:complete len:436 (+),score=21.44 TRINITY_DN5291_c0_g3_i1:104-1411(+)